jgi:DNA-binding NarL/FixJ family response regulator
VKRIMVTVHTADPLSRAGVATQLRHQPGMTVLDEAEAGASAAADGDPAAVAVAVMVVDWLDEAAVVDLRRLVRGGDRRVVLIVGELREPELVSALECRVYGILWRREVTGDRLAGVVRSAARGGSELPTDLVGRLLDLVGRLRRDSSQVTSSPTFGLVPREVDVLRLLAEGLETRQVAEKLAYSERTIKNVLHNLMTRLHLRSRAHAVAYALREGYI